MKFETISSCRVCGGNKLLKSLQFGEFVSCGIFPSNPQDQPPKADLSLVICEECLLVQLDRNFDLDSLFREDYGYESALNKSMVIHLDELANFALNIFESKNPISVLDIGSNDGTLINNFIAKHSTNAVVAVDPTIEKFSGKYHPKIDLYPTYFSYDLSDLILGRLGHGFDLITSVAMFYDLPNPNDFVKGIFNSLSENGIWVLELSYFQSMINANAFDTICHEHLEYYSLTSLNKLLAQNFLQISEIEFNKSNGGSIRLRVSKENSIHGVASNLQKLIDSELRTAEEIDSDLVLMMERVDQNIEKALSYLKTSNKPFFALGASTKGNCFLQYAKKIAAKIQGIGEINPVKFGRFSPGSNIPIHPERLLLKTIAIYIVLPWHFGDGLTEIYRDKIESGEAELMFVLPEFNVVNKSNIPAKL